MILLFCVYISTDSCLCKELEVCRKLVYQRDSSVSTMHGVLLERL